MRRNAFLAEVTGTKSVRARRKEVFAVDLHLSKLLHTKAAYEIGESAPVNTERAGPSDIANGLALILVLFAGFILHIHEEWSLNPQYAYGWGVPILGALLFRNRWRTRPEATPSTGSLGALAGAIALLAVWLPVRILREANMDWRLVQWVIACGSLGLILGVLHWMGGRRWLGHFAFPAVFLLIAVPWPTRVENLLVQTSTEWVVRGSVEALRWMGIAAWSAGNVIQLPSTAVGVDEACSGLRSFQGALMCALFFGEVKGLTARARAALLGCGVLAALGLNFGRTLVLTSLAARGGTASVEFWHDRTGFGTLLAAFFLLWFVAQKLARTSDRPEPALPCPAVRPIPFVFFLGCTAWFITVEAASWMWFKPRNAASTEAAWELDPRGVNDLKSESIPARVQAILKFDHGAAYRRSAPDGSEWWIYSIGWSSKGGGAPQARFHSPEVCLPAAGLKLAERGGLLHPVGDELPFRWHRFDWQGKPVYLFSSFHSSTRTGAIQSMDEFDLTWRKRMQSAWQGERPAEQRVFQVLISGASSEIVAREAFQEFARQTLRKGPGRT